MRHALTILLLLAAAAVSAGPSPQEQQAARAGGIAAVVQLAPRASLEYLPSPALRPALEGTGGLRWQGKRDLPPAGVLNIHGRDGAVRPFAGIGLSYATRHEEWTRRGTLVLGRSFGTVVHAGADIRLGGNSTLRLSLRRSRIETSAALPGQPAGRAEMSPATLNLSLSATF
jgi:hypothetical protein